MNNKVLLSSIKPLSLEEFIGQSHLVDENGIINKMIKNHTIFSIIFYGYPGVGKSTLAILICKELNLEYFVFNPTMHSKKDLDIILKEKTEHIDQLIIIIDEFHRMNKDKQDILLNYLENNKIILFATTTENPFFVVNPAIRSRCQIVKLEQINENEMLIGLLKIAKKNNIKIEKRILEKIVATSGGDVRSALNSMQIFHWLYKDSKITQKIIDNFLKSSYSYVSKFGDELHDLKSALHKSIRGSDPDAAIYYLARLIKSQDLKAISRRLVACAYEDIGLANPALLSRVSIGVDAAERVGFPEANQILACLVIEMALSPKSNSAYIAISKALEANDSDKLFKVPEHLRDNNYKSHSKFNKGKYLYPHDFKNSWVQQEYLPSQIKNEKFYIPKPHSEVEKKYLENLNKMKIKK